VKLPPILDTAAVRAVDATAISRGGLPGCLLMRKAAQSLVDRLGQVWPHVRAVLVVAGPGNNGGDGYLVARLLRERGVVVRLVAPLGRPLVGDALTACDEYTAAGGLIEEEAAIRLGDAQLIVDALLGTGLTRDLGGAALDVVRAINASGLPVIAADTPSGLDTDTGLARPEAVRATETITFVADKIGFHLGVGPDHVGILHTDTLGVPEFAFADAMPRLVAISETLVARLLPRRRRTAHKGDHGRVVVVGGGAGMPGAARLAGEAALRAGAGLVTVVTHPSHASAIAMSRPELISLGLDGSGSMRALLESADVIAVGPGLGQTAWARDLYAEVLECGRPLVVDADALNLLAVMPQRRGNWILTPHPGEASRLLGWSVAAVQADRLKAVDELATRYDATVVLKGARTLVTAPGCTTPLVCLAGNPGMATAGMGDVLTGIIAAVAAQQTAALNLLEAAAVGVQVHGNAGDLAAYAEAYAAAHAAERGLMASDLMQSLRRAVNP